MKKGEHIEVVIDELTIKGDGLARLEGREICVPRTVPGDRVWAYIKRKRKGRFEGEADKLLEPGRLRRPVACPHFGLCGGCRWQDIAYEDQLELKADLVKRVLVQESIDPDVIEPILPSPTEFFYRNKMEYSFGKDRDGQLQLGLHERGRFNRVFDVSDCQLQSDYSNQIVKRARELAKGLGLPVYDLKSHEGLLRFLVIRSSWEGIMINLVVAEYPHPGVDQLVRDLVEEVEAIKTAIITLHKGKAQVATGEAEFVLKGNGRLVEKCGGLAFDISPQSFFQTNTGQAERLYNTALEFAGDFDGGDVGDIYCGTGAITLLLAQRAKRVVGIEVVEAAVANAKKNAAQNHVDNCEFLVGTAEDLLEQLTKSGTRFSTVVIDPPRAGIHPRALAAIAAMGPPVLIYVSCNVQTLGRDVAGLCQKGYSLERVKPVDMFPQTPHCELVARLTLKE